MQMQKEMGACQPFCHKSTTSMAHDSDSPAHSVTVYLYGYDGIERIEHNLLTTDTAESVCAVIAQRLGIGTLAVHLFGLVTENHCVWLAPSRCLDPDNSEFKVLYFRARFLVPKTKFLHFARLDKKAVEYMYLQCRNDVVSDRLLELYHREEIKDKAYLGLAILDTLCYVRKHEMSINTVRFKHFKSCLPMQLRNKYRTRSFEQFVKDHQIKKTFRQQLNELNQETVNDSLTVLWSRYIKGIFEYVPQYLVERFNVVLLLSGEKTDRVIEVNPENELAVLGSFSDLESAAICKMADAASYRISFKRKNHRFDPPIVLLFPNQNTAESFLSLLLGYCRLTIDFYHCLCMDLQHPVLRRLKQMSCHGPIDKESAKFKLKEAGPNSYLIRQKSDSFTGMVLMFFGTRLYSISIDQAPAGMYKFSDIAEDREFSSLNELLRHYPVTQNLNKMIEPASGECCSLLLCKDDVCIPEDNDELEMLTRNLPMQRLFMSNEIKILDTKLGSGYFTDVHLATLMDCGRTVAVKQLKDFPEKHRCLEFLQRCTDDLLKMRSANIVKLCGVLLSPAFYIVFEHAPLGSLAQCLHRRHMAFGKLCSIALNLSGALMDMEEAHLIHGNIRCNNVLVFKLDEEVLVKLADPGMVHLLNNLQLNHQANQDRLPWLAPELHASLGHMSIQTDIYAFGKTLYELFNKGDQPPTSSADTQNKSSHTPTMLVPNSKDSDCMASSKADMARIISECCRSDPTTRPTTQSICRQITDVADAVVVPRAGGCSEILDDEDDLDDSICTPDSSGLGMTGDDYGIGRTFPGLENLDLIINHGHMPKSNLNDVPKLVQNTPCPLISYTNIVKQKELGKGKGHFGHVYRGQLFCRQQWIPCAIKQLKPEHTNMYKEKFEEEVLLLSRLKHENIVQMYGMCPPFRNKHTDFEEPMLLVMELLERGDIQDLLAQQKRSDKFLPTEALLKYCLQVATGMQYIGSLETPIVHRDLSARNVLVSVNNVAKISDFGLARFLATDTNYYKLSEKGTIPILCYAPECMEFSRYSIKSDVWSYGVLTWEIFSYGSKPNLIKQSEIPSILRILKEGKQLSCPAKCPDYVYNIMKQCWNLIPEKRPDFATLIGDITYMLDIVLV